MDFPTLLFNNGIMWNTFTNHVEKKELLTLGRIEMVETRVETTKSTQTYKKTQELN